MQFKVPQNVQREDQIVGPLTLKQLIICGIGGGIAYAIYVSLGKDYLWITWLPPVAMIGIMTILFAFIRPLDLSFARFLLCYLEYALLPKKRFWIQASGETFGSSAPIKKKGNKQQQKMEVKEEKRKHLNEILQILDTKN